MVDLIVFNKHHVLSRLVSQGGWLVKAPLWAANPSRTPKAACLYMFPREL